MDRSKAMKKASREAELRRNHVGHLSRAQTFKDRKKEQARNACRKNRLTRYPD